MADTYTTYYNLTKPQIGGDPDTWGTLLNANFDTIDSTMHSISTVANAALPTTGGTLTGALTLQPASGGAQLNLASAAGSYRIVQFQTGASARWTIYADNSAESGSNAGSNFGINSYTDAGAFLNTVVSITRSTGVAAFATRPVFNGATPWDSANFNPASYALLAGATFTGSVSVNAQLNVATSGSINSVVITDTGPNGANLKFAGNGSTTPNKTIRANGGNLQIVNSAYSAVISALTDAGVWSASDFQATSDERLKKHIRPLRRGVDELKRMPPREYIKDGREEIGFLAQEARKVIPEAVTEGDDGYLRLSYGQVTALLARAILEIDARLELAGL